MSKKIAIQGFEGSFHQMAAESFFGKNIEIIPCQNFTTLINIVSNDSTCNAAVMAIENSIVGSILPNYNLLQKAPLQIVGEIYMHIQQHLLVNHEVEIDDIREVHSHPMALLQCIDFLDKHPSWKLVETDDTALSAKHIHQFNNKCTAAIASKLASSLYNLKILESNIQSVKNNYTRFLILQKKEKEIMNDDVNKASIHFQTNHTKGALSKVLHVIARNNINVSKIQSFPILESHWQYYFHSDLEFDSINQFQKTIIQLKKVTTNCKILGVYKNGK